MKRRSLAASLLFASAVPMAVFAASGDTLSSSSSSVTGESSASSIAPGIGSINVVQEPANGLTGSWTLLGPNNVEHKGSDLTQTIPDLSSGRYTFFVNPPSGATATVRIYENDVQQKLVPSPQASFNLEPTKNIRLSVHFQFTKLGSIAVTSDPLGIEFEMQGPNNMVFRGQTPESFEGQPEGQYKVQYFPPSGCGKPPAKGDVLVTSGRISFTTTFSCKAADALREAQLKGLSSSSRAAGSSSSVAGSTNSTFVTLVENGQTVILNDVARSDWYGPAIEAVTKAGFMSGYRDAKGQLTGQFGPAKNVTVAELAAVAHKVANLPEIPTKNPPFNPKAKKGWFSNVINSAEQRGWTIYFDAKIDPNKAASRGEVLVTLMQAMNMPIDWPTGSVFADVNFRTPYAGAVETAKKLGIVSGKTGPDGLLKFGAWDPINRAEFAKIITAIQEYSGSSSSKKSSASSK